MDDPRWQRLNRARLTSDERAYDAALVAFLANLARSDPHVARGLARRMGPDRFFSIFPGMPKEDEPGRSARLARGLLEQAGPALPEDVRERLSRIAAQPDAKD